MLSPLFVFYLLLFGVIGLIALTRFYPRFVPATAVIVVVLSLLDWLLVRARLPLTITISSWSTTGILPDWAWHVDETAWQVTLWLLLLLVAINITNLFGPASSPGRRPLVSQPAALLLSLALLPVIWADTTPGAMTGLMGMLVIWLGSWVWAAGNQTDVSRLLLNAGLILVSLLWIWFGGSALAGENRPVQMAVPLAASLLIGIWPLFNWRSGFSDLPVELALFLFLLPSVAGAVLLIRTGVELSPGYRLLLTGWGLLGFLQGVRTAWRRLHVPPTAMTAIVTAVAFAQAQLLILTAIWAGPEATLAELRVFILAAGILFLAGRRPRFYRWQLVAPVIVLAALAGLPFTAGFIGRGALYGQWLANGRFLLVLLLGVLYIPLVTAVYWLIRLPTTSGADAAPEKFALPDIVEEVGCALPVIGLVSLSSLSAHSLVSWIVVLVSFGAGLLLPRFVGDVEELPGAIQRAVSAVLPEQQLVEKLKHVWRGLGTAVNEATLILDGEGGLLWLLALAILFLFLQGS